MDKLEKQVNESEAERFLEKAFTKKTAFGLVGVIALAYIWFTTHIQHPQLPQAPPPSAFIQPAPVPQPKAPEIPKPVIVNDPREAPPPVTTSTGQTTTTVEDPRQKLINDRITREHDSAFASMLVPEEKPAPADVKQERQEPKPTAPAPSDSPVQAKESPYIIPHGTSASLALDSRIQGEHGGPMDAHFVRDLYLPGTRTLIVPKGSKVIGETTGVGAINQRRIAASFTVIQRDPTNRACDINLVSPALDEAGSSGLSGKVDAHLASAVLGTSLAAVLQGVSMGVLYRGGGYGPSQVIIGQTANGASQATSRLLDQFIKLPTITVHEGGLADFPFTKDTPVSLCGGVS